MRDDRLRLLLPLFLAAMFAGCATTPIPAEQAKPVPAVRLFGYQQPPSRDYATLQITRDSGMPGARNDVKISIDNHRAAEIGPGESARFYVPVGEVIIGAKLDEFLLSQPLVERTVELKPGQARRYRISITPGVGVDVHPTAY